MPFSMQGGCENQGKILKNPIAIFKKVCYTIGNYQPFEKKGDL